MKARTLLLLVLSVSAVGCDEPERHEAPAVAPPASEGHARLEDWFPPADETAGAVTPTPAPPSPHGGGGSPHGGGAPMPAAAGGPQYAGTVAETMDSGGYTYMRLDTSSGPVWIAATERGVSVGAHVTASGMVMRGFYSRTLDRTFDQLVLASAVEITPAP